MVAPSAAGAEAGEAGGAAGAGEAGGEAGGAGAGKAGGCPGASQKVIYRKSRWTFEETAALRAGVAAHGEGKWMRILRDSRFVGALARRTNVDLKDKWRNLQVMDLKKPSRETGKLVQRRMSPTGKVVAHVTSTWRLVRMRQPAEPQPEESQPEPKPAEPQPKPAEPQPEPKPAAPQAEPMGKPRRFSAAFLAEERAKLEEHRAAARAESQPEPEPELQPPAAPPSEAPSQLRLQVRPRRPPPPAVPSRPRRAAADGAAAATLALVGWPRRAAKLKKGQPTLPPPEPQSPAAAPAGGSADVGHAEEAQANEFEAHETPDALTEDEQGASGALTETDKAWRDQTSAVDGAMTVSETGRPDVVPATRTVAPVTDEEKSHGIEEKSHGIALLAEVAAAARIASSSIGRSMSTAAVSSAVDTTPLTPRTVFRLYGGGKPFAVWPGMMGSALRCAAGQHVPPSKRRRATNPQNVMPIQPPRAAKRSKRR